MKITQPTLLVDESKLIRNIERMIRKSRKAQVELRPHFKTIQSIQLGQYFLDRDIHKITVSSLRMASYFASGGWKDITLAIPINLLEIKTINNLANRIKLNVVIESEEVVNKLDEAVTSSVSTFIKLDIGTNRTGISIHDFARINALKQSIEEKQMLSFEGFLVHAGHTYGARSKTEILKIHNESLDLLQILKSKVPGSYLISMGDTPSCSIASDFGNANEIRPGNFVFYDIMQCEIGSCDIEDIAVCLACPIIAKHMDRNELIIHGGGIHLSKDRMTIGSEISYGKLTTLHDNSWTHLANENYVSKLSQEHGTLKVDKSTFDQYKVGDTIGVLPIHSCMTANLMKRYFTLDGKEISMMPTF